MLHYIKGKITMKFEGGVVVENNGIGYEVFVPENSGVYLAAPGDTVQVYTAMIVREDDITLYGFTDKDSLELFRRLITVSGVGAKGALALLSCMPTGDLKKAIVFEDSVSLTRANGIGKKTAQRIVLDLKDKLGAISDAGGVQLESVAAVSGKSEAINALISLGYSKSEAVGALASIGEEDLSTEEYIKKALKNLF
ncbi:Holliday junction branch migration protein RuvA [Bacilliculturomica massiliensis]|uniref:Holliday junction branch migration protein RuvA n=1 Tax=Bacilliculturomica massiliensis TaxID=1917867 RepID=UPI00102F7ADF|nr:Holliday junction branch migration protein RuvA [Bacilliculturomica massiliensis]